MATGFVSDGACVCALVNPHSNEPFYIGIGKETRPAEHFREASSKNPSLKSNVIRKFRRAGIKDEEMVVFLAHDLPADVARCAEEWLIADWGRRSTGEGPLTNLTAGGERCPMEDPAIKAKATASMIITRADKEYRKRQSIASGVACQNAEWKRKNFAHLCLIHKDPVLKIKRANSMRAAWADPKLKAKMANAMRAGWTAEVRAKHSAAIRAYWARRKEAA